MSALAACSHGHAGVLPSTSPSPTPSPTVTASALDLRASLRLALDTYFEALHAAGLDPIHKTDALDALIAPSCTCHRVVDVLREEARQHRYIDYGYTLRDVVVLDVGDLGGNVRYTVVRSAGAERDSHGKIVESYAPVTEKYSAHFRRASDRWLLDKVTRFA